MSSFDPNFDKPFREFADLQLRHHNLLLQGKENAPETSAVEDRMDHLWEQLDEGQRRSLSGMGSDLNWVRRKCEAPPKGRKEAKEVTEADQQELVAAIGKKDWHKILHFLRLCAPTLPVVSLAHLRGSAYDALGLPAYASAFYELTLEKDPGNPDVGVAALSSFEKTNPALAVRHSKKIMASPSLYPPAVLALAATILLRLEETADKTIDRHQISALLNQAVMRSQLEQSVEDRIRAYQMAAFGYEMIGDLSAALRCIDEGLKLSPDNESLLIDKGLVLYDSQPEQAVQAFVRVTQKETPNVWPFALLTHFYLLKSNFSLSLEMGRGAWTRADSDLLRAQLLEWQAICLTELHYPPEMVRPMFEKAISLDPSNPWISKNLSAFDEAVARAQVSQWHFEEAPLQNARHAMTMRGPQTVCAA